MKTHTLVLAQISAYMESLREEERASATREKYLRDIRAFAVFLNGRAVEKGTVMQWKSAKKKSIGKYQKAVEI